MSSFDNIFESVIDNLKKAGSIAGQKTTEAVEIGKLKYKEQMTARELTKTYAKLGALVYEARTKGEDLEPVIFEQVSKITELNQQLDEFSERYSEAIEEIKKPIKADPKQADAEIDVDIDLDNFTDSIKETFTEQTAQGTVTEVDEIVEDMKDKIDY